MFIYYILLGLTVINHTGNEMAIGAFNLWDKQILFEKIQVALEKETLIEERTILIFYFIREKNYQ